jgi:hypothetical protein
MYKKHLIRYQIFRLLIWPADMWVRFCAWVFIVDMTLDETVEFEE